MSHDMFGEVVRRSVRVGSGAWYTVPLSLPFTSPWRAR